MDDREGWRERVREIRANDDDDDDDALYILLTLLHSFSRIFSHMFTFYQLNQSNMNNI